MGKSEEKEEEARQQHTKNWETSLERKWNEHAQKCSRNEKEKKVENENSFLASSWLFFLISFALWSSIVATVICCIEMKEKVQQKRAFFHRNKKKSLTTNWVKTKVKFF